MEVVEKIKELAESRLTDKAHFIVDVLFFTKVKPYRLMVIVDGDHGVTIDTCAELSRELSAALDEQNLIEAAYTLEVSTPGLDQPLKLKRQYSKNVGRTLKIHLTNKKIVRGKLESATEDILVVDEETKDAKPVWNMPVRKEVVRTEIPIAEIEKAFVMISFK